ncbi:MAG: hypothetical protein HYR70_00505 [Chloroflexi bacterium]|nr:hypothetical protein [Chloroflexota bacterium]MBI1856084.1 hypothetical protein [Chloroflexota bacterium]
MSDPRNVHSGSFSGGFKPRKLTPEQIAQINEILASLGDYGEIRLVIQHSELRYINKMESHKAWNDQQENNE